MMKVLMAFSGSLGAWSQQRRTAVIVAADEEAHPLLRLEPK